ncbi:MAG: hypothetical protein U9R25_10450 [Chloroflexota bacterium]|nr:hypothetical protein [Chloroflexota bacterium]
MFRWWDDDGAIEGCTAAWQAVQATSFAASLNDLSGNDKLLNPMGWPGWNGVTGWAFSGSEYLRTGINLKGNFSLLVQFSDAGIGTSLIGVFHWGKYFGIRPNNYNGVATYSYGFEFQIQPPQHERGNIGLAGNQPYRDGLRDGAPISSEWTGASECYIGTMNGSTAFFVGNIQAVAIYHRVLSPNEVSTIASNMEALQNL